MASIYGLLPFHSRLAIERRQASAANPRCLRRSWRTAGVFWARVARLIPSATAAGTWQNDRKQIP